MNGYCCACTEFAGLTGRIALRPGRDRATGGEVQYLLRPLAGGLQRMDMATADVAGSTAASKYAVWAVDSTKNTIGQTEGTVKNTLLNPCLALMKHLMSCRHKSYIQGVICSRFKIEELKEARKLIFMYHNPEEPYAYRGPNKTPNERDRLIHAFDGIFDKLVELDSKGSMPIIACPSEDMGLLLSLHNDPIIIDDRFRKLEQEIQGLRHTFQTVMRTVTSSDPMPPTIQRSSGIQPSTRARLNSESNKRRRTDNGEVRGSDSEGELQAMDDGFELPREQQRRQKRKTYSAQLRKPATSASDKNSAGTTKSGQRPKAIWGKSGTVPNVHLSGPPPEIFMMNCRLQIEEENVKQHFESLGITVLEVKKKSHENARKHSFVITPSTRDDYDKIMSGEFIPTDVGVRKYFRRRYQQAQESAVSNHALMSDDEFLATSPNQTSTSGTFTLSKQQLQNHSVAINHQDGSR